MHALVLGITVSAYKSISGKVVRYYITAQCLLVLLLLELVEGASTRLSSHMYSTCSRLML